MVQGVLPGLIVPANSILERINSAPCDYDSIVAVFGLLSRENIKDIFSNPGLVETTAGVIHDKLWVDPDGKVKCLSWRAARAYGHNFCLRLQFQSLEIASEGAMKIAAQILPRELWTLPLVKTIEILQEQSEGREKNEK